MRKRHTKNSKHQQEHLTASQFKEYNGMKRKYNNHKIEIDGFTFDSKLEADFYQRLKPLVKTGKIKELKIHPRYLLQEGFSKNGKHFNPIYYVADFEVTYDDGVTVIYDTKGIRTEVYKIKRKLFEYRYRDKTIVEVDK